MSLRNLFESSKSDWKSSIMKDKGYKEIVKYLAKMANEENMDIEANFISDLGTALSYSVNNEENGFTLYAYYDDKSEGLDPDNYYKDNTLPLVYQIEANINDNSEQDIQIFKFAQDAIKFIKKMV